MQSATYLFFNEKLKPANDLLLPVANRSFRYGEGCFETMKYREGKIELLDLHLERLFFSMERLQLQRPVFFTKNFFTEAVKQLVHKNNTGTLARIRLVTFGGSNNLFEINHEAANIVIECFPLEQTGWQKEGLRLDFYTDARKSVDQFANIKSNNFLTYCMGAKWAKQQQLDDAILCNNHNAIADTTIANIFIVKDGIVFTPPLSDGCVAGVTRRYLLQRMIAAAIPVQEKSLLKNELESASEVFLTNSIFGIRWVKQIGQNQYSYAFSRKLWQDFFPVP